LDDLDTVAADAITDGADDKKCDIVFLDIDNGYAVVAQCYLSAKQRKEAPANKASDLNTAVNWLLQRDLNDLPERIRSAADDLRKSISNRKISQLYLWYIHNLPESKNVSNELKTVEATASAALERHFEETPVSVAALEVGAGTFAEWYNDTQSPILVTEAFTLRLEGGYEETGDNWQPLLLPSLCNFFDNNTISIN
jgi:hypothetical protein